MISQLFPHFTNELVEEIESLGTIHDFKAGDFLVRKGQKLRMTTIVISGCVKGFQENNEGSQFVITYLRPGDCFAVSVSEDSPEPDKIALLGFEATEATTTLTLSFANKDMLAKKYDQWYKYVLQTAVKYYAFYIDLIDNIAFQKMDSRIEYFLLRLRRIRNSNTLQITHQEIADGLNSSRVVVSRLLKKMEIDGKIKIDHNTIKLIGYM
jgi:CRP/FNR family transcriptional regulator, anaerobic regulatory protein